MSIEVIKPKPNPIQAVALTVHDDEPCWGMREGPQIKAGKLRWVLRLLVIRGDQIAVYSEDIGPASDYERAAEIVMPSFGENTVAELREYAERNRHDDTHTKRAEEMTAESTMISDIINQLDESRDATANRSAIGPLISKQRNEFPREAVRQFKKEKRNARRN